MANPRQSIKGKGDDAFWSEDEKPTSKPARQQDSKTATKRPKRVKATFYLSEDDIITLEELKIEHRRQTGEKTDKSQLIREAINLLKSQYNSKTVSQ